MNKRGISPLIATVLIIGFTVALAAIIITWGGRFVSDIQDDVDVSTRLGLACSKLNFKISDLTCSGTGKCLIDTVTTCESDGDCTGAGDSCDEYQVTDVTLVNDADQAIADFYVRITESDDNVIVDQDVGFVAPDIELGAFDTATIGGAGVIAAQSTGNPTKVEVIPLIEIDNENEVCSSVIVVKEKTAAPGVCS